MPLHQIGPDERLGEGQQERGDGGGPDGMTPREEQEGASDEREDEGAVQPADQSMGELDDRLDLRRDGDDGVPISERPVVAAAVAGAGGAHDRPDGNDQKIEKEQPPRETPEGPDNGGPVGGIFRVPAGRVLQKELHAARPMPPASRGMAVLYYSIPGPKSITEAADFVKRITNFLITFRAFRFRPCAWRVRQILSHLIFTARTITRRA